MKHLLRLSMLLLIATLVACTSDNNDDDKKQEHPNPQPTRTIANFTGEVEVAVDAPQACEKIKQDLTENPPFGGSKVYQLIMNKYSTNDLYAVNPKDDKSGDKYILNYAGKAEWKDNYKLLPAVSTNLTWYKWNIVPATAKDGKPVATYDVFVKRNNPASLAGSKWYFCEDLTDKYRQKFPNEDIRAVVRRLVLTYINGGDIVNE